MASSFNRRDFLTYSGAAVAGVTLGETGRRWLARADERHAVAPKNGTETWAVSVCRECPAACGIRVRLKDGVPIKLEGNPNCPVARGRLCAKGQASLEAYYDPDRLLGPARRVGKRGEQKWEPLSWPDAITLLVSRLDLKGTPDAMLALGGDERGPIDDAWSRFWTTMKADVAWTLPATAERFSPSFSKLTGANGDPTFDLEHATYVLSFCAPLVEDWLSPVWTQRSYGRFRRSAGRSRGRLVQIDQRRSMTARKADEWLPVLADRQAYLAYGIASVLLREDRIDRRLVAQLGGNATDFENEVTTRFTPDAVALATGVPVVTLLRLARELTASAQPLVVVAADAPSDLIDAVSALNALIGAIDRPGGMLATSGRTSATRDARSATAMLADLRGRRTPPALVALRDASPLRALAAPHDASAALERCGFVVSFSPYLDEAADAADLLLPIHTPLESWHACAPAAADGSEKLACAKPVVPPKLDTRDLVTVLRMVADKVGGALPAACPASSAEAIQPEIDRLWALRRGVPYATGFETSWVLQLERGGWWVPPAASREEFGRAVLNAGGWVDPYVGVGSLRQSIIRRGGLTFAPPASRAIEAPLPDVVVAAFSPDPTAAPAAPATLRLLAFTPATVNLAGSPNQPALFELLGQPDNAPWQVWAELNPETARRFGIDQGAKIRISSAGASIDVTAALVERTPAGSILVAYVPALASGGRWARRMDADVRRLWPFGNARESVDVHVARV